MHSPTQTTFKSKWNTFKEWFKPDILTKRRPSQCSTTSTFNTATTCSSNRPSLDQVGGGVLDKCMSPFRRRPSNASSCYSLLPPTLKPTREEIEKLNELYDFALDEINYAEDSYGSPYYHGDRISAKEAIDNYKQSLLLLIVVDKDLISTIALKISTLSTKFDALPLQQNDQLFF